MKVFKMPEGINSTLPYEVDWRTMGAVGDIKDQVSEANIIGQSKMYIISH